MRKVKVEHIITDPMCLARVVDAGTGELLERVIALDSNLTAGSPTIEGTITRYLVDSEGDRIIKHEEGVEDPVETEDVEIVYIDTFDQSKISGKPSA